MERERAQLLWEKVKGMKIVLFSPSESFILYLCEDKFVAIPWWKTHRGIEERREVCLLFWDANAVPRKSPVRGDSDSLEHLPP